MMTESIEGEWREPPEEGSGPSSGNSDTVDEIVQKLIGMTREQAKKVLADLGKGNHN